MQRSDLVVAPILAVASSIVQDGLGGLYDCCMLLKPFEKVDTKMGYDSLSETKNPSICISCNAVLCLYCSVSENGEFWRCALCKSLNPSSPYLTTKGDNRRIKNLDAEEQQSIYRMKQPGPDSVLNHMMEFRSMFCEYREDIPPQSLSSRSLESRRAGFDYHIFAIDCSSIGFDEGVRVDRGGLWLLRLLEEACAQLRGQRVQVGFLLFRGDGSSCAINILRLSGSGSGRGLGSGSGLMEMDSISGKPLLEEEGCTTTDKFYDHCIRIGAYTSLASVAHKHFGSIKAAVLTAAGTGTTPPSRYGTAGPSEVAMSKLISIAGRFSSSLLSTRSEQGCRYRQVRLSLVLSGPLPIGRTAPECRGDGIGDYSSLGQLAFSQQHVSIDTLLFINPQSRRISGRSITFSADVSYADRLEALVEPSGGIALLLPAAVDDGDAAEAVRLSFLQACATAEPDTLRGDIASDASLEVRTCGRLSVRRVTGPVHPKPQPAVGSLYSASLRSRFRPDTTIFLQLERVQGQDKAKDSFSNLTLASRESVKEESDMNGTSINRLRYAYIQIVVRFDVCEDESASADGPSNFAVYRPVETDDLASKGFAAEALHPIRVVNYTETESGTKENVAAKSGRKVAHRVTRVWTQRIELTSDVNEYLECVDENLLAIVLCKGIVAKYHEQSRKAFGGAKKTCLDEEGKYLHRSIRASALSAVDELVRNVANLYIRNKRKTMRMCRIFYGLREGPLLDGPAMQSIDAYMVRSGFLRHYSYRQSMSSLVSDLVVYPAILFKSKAQVDMDIVVDRGIHLEIFSVPAGLEEVSLTYWGLSLSLPPESLSVLPDAVTLVDCGDVIVVRVGPIAAETMKIELKGNSVFSDPLSVLASVIVQRAHTIARQRYPVCEVRVLSTLLPPPTTTSKHRSVFGPATSGQDRQLYSRLSPSHMDSKESIMDMYCKWGLQKTQLNTADSNIQSGSGWATPANNDSAENISAAQVVLPTGEFPAARRSLCDLFDLREDNISTYIIGRSPITDQVFFHKYILLALPAVASSGLLSMPTPLLQTPYKGSKSSMSRLTRSNSNISTSQVMERDPVNPTDDFSASNDGMMDFFDAPSDKDLRNQWNSRGDSSSNDLVGVCVTPSASEKPKFSVQSLLERMMKISPMKIPSVQVNMADDEDDKAIVFDDETRSLV